MRCWRTCGARRRRRRAARSPSSSCLAKTAWPRRSWTWARPRPRCSAGSRRAAIAGGSCWALLLLLLLHVCLALHVCLWAHGARPARHPARRVLFSLAPQMEGVQATLTIDDVVESELALKRNPQFQALVAERYGITDLSLLAVDPWCACCACACACACACLLGAASPASAPRR